MSSGSHSGRRNGAVILGAHPADTMPPNVDVIANLDSPGTA
jgi:hypothetical protein